MESTTKKRILNLLLIVTFQFGYMEWGGGNSSFIYQAAAAIIRNAGDDPGAFLHPFIIIPLGGLVLLLVTVFQKKPSRRLTLIGLGSLSVLMLFLFLIGLISLNTKILLSTIPFLVIGVFVLCNNLKKKVQAG